MVFKLKDDLETLRKLILEVDQQIFELAAKRFRLVARVGDYKKQQGLPVINLYVEKEVINRALKLGETLDLPKDFSSKIINLFIQESVWAQAGSSANRVAYLYNIAEQVKELEAKGESVIKLNFGEPAFFTIPQVKKVASPSLKKTCKNYSSSQGMPELRSAIATELSQKHDCTISAEQVLITPSGKFAVFAAIVSMISLGDRVLIPEPSWPIYENCTRLVGGRVDSIHTRLKDDWRLNMEQLEEALAVKPKLLIVCNPNNPTGKIVSETDLKEICQLAEAQGTVVLSDETHSAYTFTTSTSILDVTASNFIYVDNFSKSYGLKGERIGYAVSNLETTTRMNRLLQFSIACIPEFVQRAALNDLPIIQQNVEAFMKEMDERIELACKELINHSLSFTRPEGGIHIFPRTNIEDFDSRMFTKTLLSKKKVAVVPGEAFGEYPEHFRLSLGTNKRDIKEGVKRIGALLEEWL